MSIKHLQESVDDTVNSKLKNRLVLTGSTLHERFVTDCHELLDKQGIIDDDKCYDPNLAYEHKWNQRWMAPTFEKLMALVAAGDGALAAA